MPPSQRVMLLPMSIGQLPAVVKLLPLLSMRVPVPRTSFPPTIRVVLPGSTLTPPVKLLQLDDSDTSFVAPYPGEAISRVAEPVIIPVRVRDPARAVPEQHHVSATVVAKRYAVGKRDRAAWHQGREVVAAAQHELTRAERAVRPDDQRRIARINLTPPVKLLQLDESVTTFAPSHSGVAISSVEQPVIIPVRARVPPMLSPISITLPLPQSVTPLESVIGQLGISVVRLVPALSMSVPVPKALFEPTANAPEVMNVPPVYELFPDRVSVPPPLFVTVAPAPPALGNRYANNNRAGARIR